MGETLNKLYEMRILVRPGPACGMPASAVGGEALCFVGAADRDTAIRTAFVELQGRGYHCERLLGRAALLVGPAGWEAHARELRRDLAARYHGKGAGLPAVSEIRQLSREGGFHLGA